MPLPVTLFAVAVQVLHLWDAAPTGIREEGKVAQPAKRREGPGHSLELTKYKIFYNKMDQVLKKNSTFKIFQNMQAGMQDDRYPSVLMTWANSSTVLLHWFDVERSFSYYKHF